MKTINLIFIFFTFVTVTLFCQTNISPEERLNLIVSKLEQKSGGTIGIAALQLETGNAYYYNKNIKFPMASTFKVPVAVQLLNRVDKGEISLQDMIEIKRSDLHPGSGVIVKYFEDLGIQLSLNNLMKLMLIESDNSAADLCLKFAGGTEEVNEMLNENGIEGMSVDRLTYVALAQYLGVKNVSENEDYDDDKVVAELRSLSKEDREKASEEFMNDTKDNSTPSAMLNLLEKIWNKKILSDESTALLLNTMKECNTGNSRIKGLLHDKTIVYPKTGTIGDVTNDVGIIKLPEDFGNLAVVVFMKNAKKDTKDCERIIAQISRFLYDYFIFYTS